MGLPSGFTNSINCPSEDTAYITFVFVLYTICQYFVCSISTNMEVPDSVYVLLRGNLLTLLGLDTHSQQRKRINKASRKQ